MLATLNELNNVTILQDIAAHAAWYGHISGLDAEKSLRGKNPYVYLLRSGEYTGHYYLSFVLPDGSIRHQPFTIMTSPSGWFYENGCGGGPFLRETIDDVTYLIMHCRQHECKPLVRFETN